MKDHDYWNARRTTFMFNLESNDSHLEVHFFQKLIFNMDWGIRNVKAKKDDKKNKENKNMKLSLRDLALMLQ